MQVATSGGGKLGSNCAASELLWLGLCWNGLVGMTVCPAFSVSPSFSCAKLHPASASVKDETSKRRMCFCFNDLPNACEISTKMQVFSTFIKILSTVSWPSHGLTVDDFLLGETISVGFSGELRESLLGWNFGQLK